MENDGDPNIRSSYNKNAHDLAKDDLDAAEHIIKDKSAIRKVIADYDQTKQSGALFGNGKVSTGSSDMYADLGDEGSAVVMNIEMNKSLETEASTTKAPSKEKKKTVSGGKGGGAGGAKKGGTGKKKM